jgi:hypothetical protein
MHRSIAAFALCTTFLLAGGEGKAQVLGGPRTFVGPGGPVSLTPGYGYGYGAGGGAPVASFYSTYSVPPYSYYAATQAGVPARIYTSGYGDANFPFYGKTYGLPNDPWSWPYLSGGYHAAVARYYYPPLGF